MRARQRPTPRRPRPVPALARLAVVLPLARFAAACADPAPPPPPRRAEHPGHVRQRTAAKDAADDAPYVTFTLHTKASLPGCSQGVTILVEPDHVFLGGVTVDDATAIAEALAADELPARWVLSRNAVDRG